jgi:16S rRNA (cytidine1402-2'-O)-methyltransferase
MSSLGSIAKARASDHRNGTISHRPMSGTLYLVATPIGNLEDITLRAIRVLREVEVIAAEDTRRTAHLLAHFGIETRMVSFHQHNTRTRVPQLTARLLGGESIAVVSDAGTPVMSDPGLELVQSSIAAGIQVDSIPGAHAGLTAVVLSGFPTERVTILGFPPSRGIDRKEWVADVVLLPDTVVLLESPHRISSLISCIIECSVVRPIVVARELTKVHQTLYRGNPEDVLPMLGAPKGEFTVVLGPLEAPESTLADVSPGQARTEFGELTNSLGLGRRQAVVALAIRHGLRPREVYSLLESSKN